MSISHQNREAITSLINRTVKTKWIQNSFLRWHPFGSDDYTLTINAVAFAGNDLPKLKDLVDGFNQNLLSVTSAAICETYHTVVH